MCVYRWVSIHCHRGGRAFSRYPRPKTITGCHDRLSLAYKGSVLRTPEHYAHTSTARRLDSLSRSQQTHIRTRILSDLRRACLRKRACTSIRGMNERHPGFPLECQTHLYLLRYHCSEAPPSRAPSGPGQTNTDADADAAEQIEYHRLTARSAKPLSEIVLLHRSS